MLFIFRICISIICFKKIMCGFQDREVKSLASVRTSLSAVQTLISQVASVRTMWFSVWTPIIVQNLRIVQDCIHSDVSAPRLNTIQYSTSKRIFFADTDMGRHLQPSGWQVYTVRTPVLIMKIECSRSATVRTLGQHCRDTALFRKEYQRFRKFGCTVGHTDALSCQSDSA